MVRVLFVCLGNICRSPTSEGVFRKIVESENLLEGVGIDSAGTHAYHIGEPPDPRAQAAAARRGIDLSSIRGRQVADRDFHEFDYILAMDHDNFDVLQERCPQELRHKIRLFMDLATNFSEQQVPDPYFGGTNGFDRVLDMIEDAAAGLLGEIHGSRVAQQRR